MKIILLRHGKPDIPSLDRMNATAFSEWVNVYNAAGLSNDSKPTRAAIDIARECDAVVCSSLPRSIQTARALGIESITLSVPIFNEADLPVAAWPFIKLSPGAWAVIFRLLWLFGYAKNVESWQAAKARAAEAAEILIKLAGEKHNVLVAGHGVFNRLLAKALTSCGWSGPQNPGSGHWQFAVYEYTESNRKAD